MRSLVRRGMDLAEAKRAIEALSADREVVVTLPKVEDPNILIAELAYSGIGAVFMAAETPVLSRVPAPLG